MLRRCPHGLASPSPLLELLRPPRTSIRQRSTSKARHASRHYTAGAAPTEDIAVLGGGVSGLASAYYLTRELPNARVTVYEASDRIGGWLSSKRVPVKDGTILFEGGPRSLRHQSNGVLSVQLLQELDLTGDTIFTQKTSPAARNRYLYYPDHIVRMPHPSFGIADNLWNLLTEPVFSTTLWSAAGEFFKDPRNPSVQDESVGDFFSRRFSKTMVDRLLSGVIHGIYAGDVYQLSARSLFPGLWRDDTEVGGLIGGMIKSKAEGLQMSKRDADFVQEMQKFTWDPLLKATMKDNAVFTFKDGLGMLSDRLASKLFETGRVTFQTGSPVQSIVPTEDGTAVVVSSPGLKEKAMHTHVVSSLLPGHLNAATKAHTGASPLIPPIPSVTVMTVNLYFRTPNLHAPGFGYLIPQATPFEQNPERALGVVFDTAYSPSATDADPKSWHDLPVEKLQAMRADGRLINVNDFAWYNMPDAPVMQDDVPVRGTKLTVMLGGHWWDNWPAYPNEQEGLAMARSVLERHLGIKEAPEAWQVNMQRDCIPQYTLGHEDRIKQAHNNLWREFKGRVRVTGNWMSGVGVNDCLRSAYEVARNFRKQGTGLEQVGETELVRLKPVRRRRGGEEEEE